MWFRFASAGYLGSFPPALYLVIIPVETATHLCGAVDGGPVVAGQEIEDDAGTLAGPESWAGSVEAEASAKTVRSNNRVIRGV